MKLFKSYSEKEVKRVRPIINKINGLEEEISKLSDSELRAKTQYFKEQLKEGKTLDDILPEAFAVVREASKRVLGMRHFDVQLIGGIILHQGRIAEMKTGEGKTLTSIFPVYLNALTGKGVHVITVNDYLAERDARNNGKVLEFLGLTVGLNKRELTPQQKQEAHGCDVTYTTNAELGFDYLRDNMVTSMEDKVLVKGLNYALIDEVDSILIDESRTPLIISGGKKNTAALYLQADRFVKSLIAEKDYEVDIETKTVSLTPKGIEKAEKGFKIDNLYDIQHTSLVHHINQALKANYAMTRDVEYMIATEDGTRDIRNAKIMIIDQFTGRVMPGRAYSDGLHQAIEAKEGVPIKEETETRATITYQNFFRLFNKLAGMTGTAKTEEEEFRNIYNMYVIQIPTNKPVIREDLADLVYSNEKGKYKAIVKTIKQIHETGQPILVGTISVEANEHLSALLKKEGLKHEVLNAKNHEREAEIIAKAGEKGAITIATNMAGRGTDIKLGEGVVELGGLCVIGTERHESRRIDNQLRGRAGRQGDPGMSQFFVSFEDDLMRRFGTEKIKNMLQSLGITDDQSIRSKTFTRSIESAQKKVEGNNFDNRKSLLDYDDIMNEQRDIIYSRRNEILDNEDIHARVIETFKLNISSLVESHIEPEGYLTDTDLSEIVDYFNVNLAKNNIEVSAIENKTTEEVITYLSDYIINEYEDKLKELPKEITQEFERAISLRVIDDAWIDHISDMEHLREGIGLRGYGQTNPLQAYAMEGYELFDRMLDNIDAKIAIYLLNAEITQNTERKQPEKLLANDGKTKAKAQPKKVKKVGRNELCPCGSGKKYKQCCGK